MEFAVPGAGLGGWATGDGSVLALVLHGGPGLTDYTETLADEVLAGGRAALRVARFQQRGQPPSTLDGPFTVAQMVADVVAVIDHLGADRAVLVGHSWGGHLAMHAAVAAPDRILGLLLIDSLGGVGDGGESTMAGIITGRLSADALAELAGLERDSMTSDADATTSVRLLWPGYFSNPALAPPAPSIEMSQAVHAAVFADARRLLSQGVLERLLPSVTAPSIHLIGKQSPVDPDVNERTAALMPGAMVELLDTGHFTWIEQPGCVSAATRRLLDTLASMSP